MTAAMTVAMTPAVAQEAENSLVECQHRRVCAKDVMTQVTTIVEAVVLPIELESQGVIAGRLQIKRKLDIRVLAAIELAKKAMMTRAKAALLLAAMLLVREVTLKEMLNPPVGHGRHVQASVRILMIPVTTMTTSHEEQEALPEPRLLGPTIVVDPILPVTTRAAEVETRESLGVKNANLLMQEQPVRTRNVPEPTFRSPTP